MICEIEGDVELIRFVCFRGYSTVVPAIRPAVHFALFPNNTLHPIRYSRREIKRVCTYTELFHTYIS